MLALIITPLKPALQLVHDKISPANVLDQSTTNQHTCPCCSYVLLRHARLGGLYWRCPHCYEEMPAWS